MLGSLKLMGVTAAAVLTAGVSAQAAVVDFTAYSVGTVGPLTGSIGSTNWVLTSSRGQVRAPEACTSPVPSLACVNDGLGISGAEIRGGAKNYLTITFSRSVALVATSFLDLFVARDGSNAEIAYITKGIPSGVPGDVTVVADQVFPSGNGFKMADGFKLVGDTFSFFVDPVGNDNIGRPDAALASIEIAPVPLPAGGLLIASALGGLGLLRRKKKTDGFLIA